MKRVGLWVSVVALVACGGSPFDAVGGDASSPVVVDPPVAAGDAGAETSSDAHQAADGGNEGGNAPEAGPTSDSGIDAGAGQDAASDAGHDSGSEGGPLQDGGGSSDAGNDSGPVSCNSGDMGCSGNVPRSCVGGQWQNLNACTAAVGLSTCLNGTCVACSPGSSQCSGNGVETCDANGHWSAPMTCSGSDPVCLGGACVECNPNDKTCQGSDSLSCDQTGHWSKTSTCQYGCQGAGVCNACATNMVECLSDNNPDPAYRQNHAFVCGVDNLWHQDGVLQCQMSCVTTNRFNVNVVNDTVGDTTTGLTWERGNSAALHDGYAATAYCQTLAPAGAWRLPTIAELSTLFFEPAVDGGKPACQPDIDQVVFPDTFPVYFTSDSLQYLNETYVSFQSASSYKGGEPAGVKCVHN